MSLCNAGSVSTLSTRGQYSSIHGCHVDLVTEVIQAPRQALAISQDCCRETLWPGAWETMWLNMGSIQKYWEPKAWLVALEVVTQATLSAGSRSLSLRLSQHHHNKRRSPWARGGGKVCRDNRRGSIFYRRQSRGSAVGRKWETIVSGTANQRLRVLGSWGAVGAVQRDGNGECGVCTAQSTSLRSSASIAKGG